MATAGITYSIGLKNSGFLRGIRGAQSGVASLGRSIAGLGAKAAMAGGVIGLAGLAGSIALLRRASREAATVEQLAVAFEVLVGDAERAAQVLGQIRDLGASTPFEFEELANAGKLLLGLGENADTLTDTLRRLGDISAALNIPLSDLADIYGKARVQGRLFTEDINQLQGRGINVVEGLARVMGKTEQEIRALVTAGKVGFPELEQAIRLMTDEGGKFFGMMAAQSRTTNGLLSTLRDNIRDVLVTLGTPVNDFLKPILSGAIERLQRLGAGLKAFIELLTEARKQGRLGELVSASFNVAMKAGINTLSSGIRGVVGYLGAALPRVFTASLDALDASRILTPLKTLFSALGGMLKAAILDAASNLPGLADLAGQADDLAAGAAADFKAAGIQFRNIDFGAGLLEAGRGIRDAHEAGAKAFQDAAAQGQIFDLTGDKAALDKVGGEIDASIYGRLQDALAGRLPAQVEAAGNEIVNGAKTVREKLQQTVQGINQAAVAGAMGEAEQPGRRRGLLNAAESFAARMARRSRADRDKDQLGASPTDRASLNAFFRRQAGVGALDGPTRIMSADRLRNLLPGSIPGGAARERRTLEQQAERQTRELAAINSRLQDLGLAAV